MKYIAVEDDTPEVVEEQTPAEIVSDDIDMGQAGIDVEASAQEIDTDLEQADEAVDTGEIVEEIAQRLTPEEGEERTEPTAASQAIEVAVEHMFARVGYSRKIFRVAVEQHKDHKLAVESIVEHAKELWARLVLFIKHVYEKVKIYLSQFFNYNKLMKMKAKSLIEKGKKLQLAGKAKVANLPEDKQYVILSEEAGKFLGIRVNDSSLNRQYSSFRDEPNPQHTLQNKKEENSKNFAVIISDFIEMNINAQKTVTGYLNKLQNLLDTAPKLAAMSAEEISDELAKLYAETKHSGTDVYKKANIITYPCGDVFLWKDTTSSRYAGKTDTAKTEYADLFYGLKVGHVRGTDRDIHNYPISLRNFNELEGVMNAFEPLDEWNKLEHELSDVAYKVESLGRKAVGDHTQTNAKLRTEISKAVHFYTANATVLMTTTVKQYSKLVKCILEYLAKSIQAFEHAGTTEHADNAGFTKVTPITA